MNGNGDNGTGAEGDSEVYPVGYDPRPYHEKAPSLLDAHNKSMAEIEVQQFVAEKEMNAARTEYLKALAESEEKDTNLVSTMPEPEKKAALPLGLMIGVALLLWGEIL